MQTGIPERALLHWSATLDGCPHRTLDDDDSLSTAADRTDGLPEFRGCRAGMLHSAQPRDVNAQSVIEAIPIGDSLTGLQGVARWGQRQRAPII